MKKLILFLLVSTFAFGQGSCIVTQAFTPSGQGIGGSKLAVCSKEATIPPTAAQCNATTNNSISLFSDESLTGALSNPATSDSSGNFYACAAPGTYTMCLSNASGSSTYCWNQQFYYSPNSTQVVSVGHVVDMPSKFFIPAAICNNATPATTWSLPTSSAPTPTCATGTNTQVGTLNFADGNSAQATYYLPSDWDSSSSVDSKVFFSSVSTSGTMIFNLAAGCTAVDGSQADDQAFNSAVAYSTITLNATANATWAASLTGLTITGCSAGDLLHIKLSRATDTAAGAGAVRGVALTVRRTF